MKKFNSVKLHITGLNALKDNYIWMIRESDQNRVIIVDPGEEKPVITALERSNLILAGILVTHHHWDHTNGVLGLREKYDIPVFWSKDRHAGEEIIFPDLSLQFRVLALPGHTLDHVAYWGHRALFCGDTLFTGGCGRLFEGTFSQLYHSLMEICQLPDETEIYCGHEYTQANLQFAKQLEPDNEDITQRIQSTALLRAQLRPTVPALLLEEKKTNPFLRCHVEAVIKAAEKYAGKPLAGPVEVFEVLRNWKNSL